MALPVPQDLRQWSGAPTTSIVAIGDQGAAQAIELIADALALAATGAPAWQAIAEVPGLETERIAQ